MTWIRRLIEGASAPWEGYRYLRQHPRLWHYGLWPTLINTALTVGGLLLFIWLAFEIGAMAGWEGFWGTLVQIASTIGLLILSLLFVVVLWLLLNAILCSYFYGQLAKAVELTLGKRPEDLREISVLAQITDTLRAVGKLVLINLALIVLAFVPAIGAPISMGLTYYFNALTFGIEFFEYPLELRGLRRQEKLALLRAYRPETIGFGAVILVLSFIPILGSIILTTSVVGASLTIHRFEKSTRSSERPSS